MTSPTSGFIGWIQQYGQILLFFAQLLFWLAVSIAALWSTMLFKRLVDARTSADTPTAAASDQPDQAADKPSVEDFVD